MKYSKICGLILIFVMRNCFGQMVIPTKEKVQIIPGAYNFKAVNIVADVQPYAAGGITFNYAAGIFTQAPMISLTLEDLSMTLTTSQAAITWVTQNTATQTSIVAVMSNGSGGYQEIPTGAVNVYLHAVGKAE